MSRPRLACIQIRYGLPYFTPLSRKHGHLLHLHSTSLLILLSPAARAVETETSARLYRWLKLSFSSVTLHAPVSAVVKGGVCLSLSSRSVRRVWKTVVAAAAVAFAVPASAGCLYHPSLPVSAQSASFLRPSTSVSGSVPHSSQRVGFGSTSSLSSLPSPSPSPPLRRPPSPRLFALRHPPFSCSGCQLA